MNDVRLLLPPTHLPRQSPSSSPTHHSTGSTKGKLLTIGNTTAKTGRGEGDHTPCNSWGAVSCGFLAMDCSGFDARRHTGTQDLLPKQEWRGIHTQKVRSPPLQSGWPGLSAGEFQASTARPNATKTNPPGRTTHHRVQSDPGRRTPNLPPPPPGQRRRPGPRGPGDPGRPSPTPRYRGRHAGWRAVGGGVPRQADPPCARARPGGAGPCRLR